MNKILLFTFISIAHFTTSQNDCLPTRCSPSGPVIRFPFRLKDHHPERCGYPGFELSCTSSGITKFDLQFPLTASTNKIMVPFNTTISVGSIDYKSQKILASNAIPRSCLPENLNTLTLNSSNSAFEVEALGYSDGYTLFNCTNARDYGINVTCLSRSSYQVMAFASVYEITALPPYSSCFKMYNVSYVPDSVFNGRDDEYGTRFYVRWRKPYCGNCEEEGKFCRLKDNGAADETECSTGESQQGKGASRKQQPLIAGLITAGTVLLLFITAALYFTFTLMKRKKNDYEKIENIIENHKDMKPRRYSYADIKKITNNFSEKLEPGTLHEGMLIDKTHVIVKMLNGNDCERNVDDFIEEVERIGRMQHENILQLIGYCVNGSKRALVYEFLPRGPLEKFISLQNQSQNPGWEKLLQISIAIAKGIDYIHRACTKNTLSLDINPLNIFLDHNFHPKTLVFSMSGAQGEMKYIAPEIFSSTFGVVSEKADVYSFGMLLMDIVGRHKVKKLLPVGLWCVQWFPCDRPSIKEVIQMLEGENMPVMPSNPSFCLCQFQQTQILYYSSGCLRS
ncbi:hypothetical protein BUALT_Bualt01G0079200 [Buddleja alternifolia]|uniref:Protein kinase domain-containing protein n=1 Tax=Buddleja alternifolia TaxID=168488 RepID=A0AAV6YFU6_9LAMI|nr:hypothetical protein BUALT_Bualt01G0079200 [Buddleja alternifolia]